MLHRARGGEEKKEKRAFAPGADERRAERDRQHEKMNFEIGLAQPVP